MRYFWEIFSFLKWPGLLWHVAKQLIISLEVCRFLKISAEFCQLSSWRSMERKVIKNIDWGSLNWCLSMEVLNRQGAEGKLAKTRYCQEPFCIGCSFSQIKWVVLICIEIDALRRNIGKKKPPKTKIKRKEQCFFKCRVPVK